MYKGTVLPCPFLLCYITVKSKGRKFPNKSIGLPQTSTQTRNSELEFPDLQFSGTVVT